MDGRVRCGGNVATSYAATAGLDAARWPRLQGWWGVSARASAHNLYPARPLYPGLPDA